MRIAIPPHGEDMDLHCGLCVKFALIDRTPGADSTVASQQIQPP
jgi:hypothetical protein